MGAKLVLTGDDRQLPEIQAGGAFRALADTLDAIELRDVRRQREPWERAALAELRDGDVGAWLGAYREHDRIRGGRDAESTRAQLAEDWWQTMREHPGADVVMVAHRRADVADLNARARDRLSRGGLLGDEELHVAGRSFAEGDRVIACRNDHRAGVANGTRGRVVDIDHERSSVVVELDRGERVELDRSYLGDCHLDYAYALTAHRAQGTTVDQAFVLGSDELYREWGYTALTRHREQAFFYVNGVETQLALDGLGPDRDEDRDLDVPLKRSRAKQTATEILQRTRDMRDLPWDVGPDLGP
jgi:ATP-dependent exoDNAse (exonuclease V) alpha subunit